MRSQIKYSLPDTFCELHFRAAEKSRLVILKESLLSSSADHAQKFKGWIKKDAFSMTIPAFFASFKSLYKKCQIGNEVMTKTISQPICL